MRVVQGYRDLGLALDRAAVTIGNFDGVHIGHQGVMRAAVEASSARETKSVVCTFEPHTLKVLRPSEAPRLLQTPEQKLNAIADTGVDVAVVIPFTPELAATGRRRFVDEFLVGELAVESLHVSSGFSFGRGRSGRTEYLEERAEELGFSVTRVPAEQIDDESVSSSRIRAAVAAGEVRLAARLLGRSFAIAGEVVAGSGRGRELGVPTANIAVANESLPKEGVYSGWLHHADERLAAVVNIGRRPTFESSSGVTVEAHVLDVDRHLYGAPVELEVTHRLRDERAFESAGALVDQIRADIVAARAELGVAP